MSLTGAVAGVAVGALLLVPLAWKWHLPMRIVGTWIIVVGASSGVALQAALGTSLTPAWLASEVATILVLSASAAAAAFFRDPERVPPASAGAVVSPADGTVLYIRRFGPGEIPPVEKRGRPQVLRELAMVEVGESCHLVGIGMHLLNVHVNRAPIAGRVTSVVHTPGSFVSLRREGATTVNERLTTVIDGSSTRVIVVQIASRLVRRIECFVKRGEDLAIGQRIGMIRFGSQVDVILPATDTLDVLVEPGEIVRAGVSVLAAVRDAPGTSG